MNHPTDDQLVLHYYGEESEIPEAGKHLAECDQCRGRYAALLRMLNTMDTMPVPERGPDYGAQVWQRIEGHLPAPPWWRRLSFTPPALRWAFAGAAMSALLVMAFLAGRSYPSRPAAAPQMAGAAQVRERVLLVAVGDYLDRSQMVLVELANSNAQGTLDISSEQERAQDLLSETRLYRQTAATTGDTSVTGILDELERVMLDIAHGPSQLSPADLEKFRARLESEGILFKIRVVNSNVKRREEAPTVEASRQKL